MECLMRRLCIERRRRQEMSKLYSSLKSLLPPQHIKGKRSICDHMLEAVNYIKNLENNVQTLWDRRDNIKSSFVKIGPSNLGSNYFNCVRVNMDGHGVEILINVQDNEFKLSQVLVELMESELDVVSCVSTKMNDNFLHKIQAEAKDLTRVDPHTLRERLSAIVIN